MSDDPLPKLRVWLVKCRRHAQAPPASEVGDMIALAIAEIVKMRGVVERMEGQQGSPPSPVGPRGSAEGCLVEL